MQHCVFIKNHVPRITDIAGNEFSPFELMYHKQHPWSEIHPFGIIAFLFLSKHSRHLYTLPWKLEKHGILCVYFGRAEFQGQKAWLGYSPDLKIVLHSNTASFPGPIYPFRPAGSCHVPNLQFYSDNAKSPSLESLAELKSVKFVSETPIFALDDNVLDEASPVAAGQGIEVPMLQRFHDLTDADVADGPSDPQHLPNLRSVNRNLMLVSS